MQGRISGLILITALCLGEVDYPCISYEMQRLLVDCILEKLLLKAHC